MPTVAMLPTATRPDIGQCVGDFNVLTRPSGSARSRSTRGPEAETPASGACAGGCRVRRTSPSLEPFTSQRFFQPCAPHAHTPPLVGWTSKRSKLVARRP